MRSCPIMKNKIDHPSQEFERMEVSFIKIQFNQANTKPSKYYKFLRKRNWRMKVKKWTKFGTNLIILMFKSKKTRKRAKMKQNKIKIASLYDFIYF